MTEEERLTGYEPGLSGAFFDSELEEQRGKSRRKLFRPDTLPAGYYTREEWVDRGYVPRDGEMPDVGVLLYSGYFGEGRYSIAQCREIRGQKAARRRRLFHGTLRTQQ
jgi:hypothetical protein